MPSLKIVASRTANVFFLPFCVVLFLDKRSVHFAKSIWRTGNEALDNMLRVIGWFGVSCFIAAFYIAMRHWFHNETAKLLWIPTLAYILLCLIVVAIYVGPGSPLPMFGLRIQDDEEDPRFVN